MKTAIVTGASGFIGSALVKRLRLEGVEVHELDLTMGHDLTKPFSVPEADVIFHLAGCSDSHQNPADCFLVNILSMINVLEAARARKPRIIFASTYLNDGGGYASSKRACEIMLHLWWMQYAVPSVIVNCCNVFGPGDYNTKRVIPSLITKMLRNEPISINTCKRDFVYLNDVVDAYMLIGKAEDGVKSIVGVSASGLLSLTEVAARIRDITGSKSEITVAPLGTDAVEADGSGLRGLGWMAHTHFQSGLHATVDWWKERLDLKATKQ